MTTREHGYNCEIIGSIPGTTSSGCGEDTLALTVSPDSQQMGNTIKSTKRTKGCSGLIRGECDGSESSKM